MLAGSCPRVVILAPPDFCAKWQAQFGRMTFAPFLYNFKSGTLASGKKGGSQAKQNYHCVVSGVEF